MIPNPFTTKQELKKMEKNYVGFSWMQDWFHPPMWWLVNASAEKHDENYKIGGTSTDELIADIGFQKRNMEDVLLLDDLEKKKNAYWWCSWYYIFIRTFGWIAFNHKDKTMKHTFFGIVIGASIVIAGVASYTAYNAVKMANAIYAQTAQNANDIKAIADFLNKGIQEANKK